MNLSRRCLLTAICAFILCTEAGAKTEQPPADTTVCIHLYNLASVPRDTAHRAILRVGRAFAAAGIETTWANPPGDSTEAHVLDLNDSAESFRSDQRPCVVVIIVPDVPPGSYSDAMGFALPRSRSGVHVELVYRRIELQTRMAGVDADVVLAYVMAHEIGHVLLRSTNHSAAGIMRARAGAEAWRLTSSGMMEFLPEEAQRMRNGLCEPPH